jgi:hypothetical protein
MDFVIDHLEFGSHPSYPLRPHVARFCNSTIASLHGSSARSEGALAFAVISRGAVTNQEVILTAHGTQIRSARLSDAAPRQCAGNSRKPALVT